MERYKIIITTTVGDVITVWVEAKDWYEAATQIKRLLEQSISIITVDGPRRDSLFQW